MRANIKTNIKRGIAVGLIAIMAAVNPLQTLQPTGEGAPAVAKAAETDKAPYIGEVRLAVDKKADKAKQILESAGYEVIDQDLNEDAGSFWNKLGDQAVYMGIKRTSDEKKAIRDMKTMNMLGRYSFSDLENWVKENRATAQEKCKPILVALKEYRKNVKNGDPLSLQAQASMNAIKEDDSGELMGDLLLKDDTDETLLTKILAEGNVNLITNVFEILSTTCEEEDSTWLERMDSFTYKKLVQSYAKNLYGKDNVVGEQKSKVEQLIMAEYDADARVLLKGWDNIRDSIVVPISEFSDEELQDMMLESLSRGEEAFLRYRQNTIVEELGKIPYSGKTLLDLFKTKKSVFERDITKLYPIIAAMSDGQRALLEYTDPVDLMLKSFQRADYRAHGKSAEEVETEEIINEPISIYEGVDRDMFKEGGAITSRALSAQKSSEDFLSDSTGYSVARVASVVIGILASMASFVTYVSSLKTKGEIKLLESQKETLQGALDEVRGTVDQHGYQVASMDKQGEVYDYTAKLHSQRVFAVAMLVVAIVSAIVYTALYVYEQYEKHNIKQLPIPAFIVDKDVESNAGKLVTYQAVLWNKDRDDDSGRADRADINGDAAEQWIALYTTTDDTMGDPILADSIYTDDSESPKNSNSNQVPLTNFGESSAQNLLAYTYGGGSLWMWYEKGKVEAEIVDDTEDTDKEVVAGTQDNSKDAQATQKDTGETGAADEAEMTGSNSGGSNIVLFTLGGGVVGIIAGIFIGFFIRRKKQVV